MFRQFLLGLALSSSLPLTAVAGKQEAPAYDARLSSYEYPFAVSFATIKAQQQELQMAYMDVKPKQPNGDSVVLLHGKNFNGAYWRSTIAALTEDGFRVVVPDQIGFGKSSKPEHFQYSFQQLAQSTHSLLDALKIKRVSVVGHSMGGMLAVRFALMYPQTTEKLVLINPLGLEDYKASVPYQSVDDWYQRELKQNDASIKNYQLANYYDGQWKPEFDEWVKPLAGWTRHADFPQVAWNSALTYDMIYTQPVVHELGNITSPVLLLIGTRDRTALGKALVSEEVRKTLGQYEQLGRKARDRISRPQLVELKDVGHLPHIEAFERFYPPFKTFLAANR